MLGHVLPVVAAGKGSCPIRRICGMTSTPRQEEVEKEDAAAEDDSAS
ncbi:unnamed protein product, partial [Pylaiella littoralis]